MAHEFESGFFVAQPAWHNLGTVLECPPTVEDAIKFAGLDWTVSARGIRYLDSNDLYEGVVPKHRALVRDTDGRCLGVCGNVYEILQNSDAFKFFNPFVESGAVKLEAAGSLRKGQRIWILAKVNDTTQAVKGNDEVSAYFLLYNSHDGSTGVGLQFTSIRVVCMNTLSMAIRDAEGEKVPNLNIRHTAKMHEGLAAVQEIISFTKKTFDLTVNQYQTLAAKNLPIDGLRNYVREVFDSGENDPRALVAIEDSYNSGPGSDFVGTRGTYWGAYNALTHWLDHVRGRSEDSRINSSWFGDSKKLRDRAFDVALRLSN